MSSMRLHGILISSRDARKVDFNYNVTLTDSFVTSTVYITTTTPRSYESVTVSARVYV